MSSVKGVYRTKADDPKTSNIARAGLLSGRIKVMYDEYEASSLASGSDISMGDLLPAGAVIHDASLLFDALGGSSTLKLGDSNDTARYIAAAASSTAGRLSQDKVDGRGYVIGTNTGDNQLVVTTGGATISGTIKMIVLFSVD